MTQNQSPRRYSQQPARSRNATREVTNIRSSASASSYERTTTMKPRQLAMAPQPSPAHSYPRARSQPKRRSSSAQRSYKQSGHNRQSNQSPAIHNTITGISSSSSKGRRSTTAITESSSGSVVSAPTFFSTSSSRENREPTSTTGGKKVTRDQSPASTSIRSPSDRSVQNTKKARKVIEGKFKWHAS